jgi:uncharacterized protein YjbI with pentapeptide repeats
VPARLRPPRLPALPDSLRPLAASDELLADEETVEEVVLAGELPPGHHARLLTVSDSRIEATLAGARLPELHLRGCVVAGADLANVHALRGALHECAFENVRLTGALLTEASIRDVELAGCRADLVSFAAATLDRVVISDCDLREATFDEARLRDVRFERCDLSGTSFSSARLQRVELVDCDLTRTRSVADLRGAAMPWSDIVANAGALAQAAGIGVLGEG